MSETPDVPATGLGGAPPAAQEPQAPQPQQEGKETPELRDDEVDKTSHLETGKDLAAAKEPASDEEAAPKKPEPKRFKFKVNGQEKEYSEEDVQRAVNGEDYFSRGQKAMQEAADARKEAERIHEASKRTFQALREGGPATLHRLLTEAFGDEDKATEHLIEQFEKWVLPHYEERMLSPEDRERRAAERRTRRELEELKSYRERVESERQEMEKRKKLDEEETREISFQREIAGHLQKMKVPNTQATKMVYLALKEDAAKAKVTLGAEDYAVLIGRRLELLRNEVTPKAPPPETVGRPEEEIAEERLRNLAKAREALEEKKAENKARPSGRRTPARIPTTEEVREELARL